MPNPVTHIIVPMLIVETYRRYFAKKRFSQWYVFLAGLLGGAADFDLLFALLVTGSFDTSYHRGITHSLLLPIAMLFVGIATYYLYSSKMIRYKGWKISYYIFFIASIGWAAHILLDGFDGMVQWFYPLSWSVYLPNLILDKYRAGLIDGILFFAWLLYDEKLLNDLLCFFRLKK
jgi:membrane-bound metal-dependent hydrolase YbcI (DUF457 family)